MTRWKSEIHIPKKYILCSIHLLQGSFKIHENIVKDTCQEISEKGFQKTEKCLKHGKMFFTDIGFKVAVQVFLHVLMSPCPRTLYNDNSWLTFVFHSSLHVGLLYQNHDCIF